MARFPYKSVSWGVGTTSFRTKIFNKTIEEQLRYLNEFWAQPEYQEVQWRGNNEIQSLYYDFLYSKGLVHGDANNKPKDAREKTVGLVTIGLINDNRRLTEAGNAMRIICENEDFALDEFFGIPKDSYIYLKQLLKTSLNINGNYVRPFIVLLFVLSRTEYLTSDEFTFFLPMCIDMESTDSMIECILRRRRDQESAITDDIIWERLMSIDSYINARNEFVDTDNIVDEEFICEISMNRKSRSIYGKSYFPLYNALYDYYVNNNEDGLTSIYDTTLNLSSQIGRLWRKYLFDVPSARAIRRNPNEHKNHTRFDDATTEEEFRLAFFQTLHLIKSKANMMDYEDLNLRYFKTSDVVLFQDDRVELDTIPKFFFQAVIDTLYEDAYTKSESVPNDVTIEEINPCLTPDEQVVIDGASRAFDCEINSFEEVRNLSENLRYRRFNRLIDEKFTDENIIELLGYFEAREAPNDEYDERIARMVTDDADAPTIFEYILGVLWYKISERQGKILDYMNTYLDADLLPKTHAAGRVPDIVYEYERTAAYPAHDLILEATLTTRTNQRRMEMEPVSRHLGDRLLRNNDLDAYTIFVATYLHPNVVADLRRRKEMNYYDANDTTRFITGMKIIPLETSELKEIIRSGKKYRELYRIFEEAYDNPDIENGPTWYADCIQSQFHNV